MPSPRTHASSEPGSSWSSASPRRWEPWILGLGTLLAYLGTMHAPLVFDDESSIATNVSIRSLTPLGGVLSPSEDAGVGGRPFLNLTYALNYAWGGANVEGYHVVNTLIHILASLALLALLRRVLASQALPESLRRARHPLAFATSALWAWHPVQTQAVTYLSQRAESLMGLFYLLVLLAYFKGVDAPTRARRAGWQCVAVLACLLGVGSKELIVTAPLTVFLLEAVLVQGSFSKALRARWPLLLMLCATWVPLGLLMRELHHRGVGFEQGISPIRYLVVESQALTRYLERAFLPYPLVFDYGWYSPVALRDAWPDIVLLLALGGALVGIARSRPPLALLGSLFFLLLAPTSSIVPIASQPMAESRLYLPLAPLMLLLALGTHALLRARALPLLLALALVFAFLAFERNRDYASVRGLWEDTVANCPGNARAHTNLARELRRSPADLPAAIREYRLALALQPSASQTHMDLGDALLALPEARSEALRELRTAASLSPRSAPAHYNLGAALLQDSPFREEARAELEWALRLDPRIPQAHYDLGIVLAALPGERTRAMEEFRHALRLDPAFAPAEENLGLVLNELSSDKTEALVHLEAAVRLKPEWYEARYNLANVLAKQPGREQDAIALYEGVLRQTPAFAPAHNNLGNLLSRMPGRLDDAIAQYRQALALDPSFEAAGRNLAVALRRQQRTP